MMYQYIAGDPAAKVVSFFEQKMGLKAQPTGQDGFTILLSGASFQTADSFIWIKELPNPNGTLIVVAKGMGQAR
jgi:hypothetical protein